MSEWLKPGDVAAVVRSGGRVVPMLFDHDDGSMWCFAVQVDPARGYFYWDYRSAVTDSLDVEKLPAEVQSEAWKHVRALAELGPILVANASQQAILNAVAEGMSGDEWVSGRRLRKSASLDREAFSREVRRLSPRYLREASNHAGADLYTLTLAGMLRSARASMTQQAIEGALEIMRRRFASDPDFQTYSLDEVCEHLNIPIVADRIFVLRAISTAGLSFAGGGSISAESVTFNMGPPRNLEDLLEMKSCGEFVNYLRSASSPSPSPTSPERIRALVHAASNPAESSGHEAMPSPPSQGATAQTGSPIKPRAAPSDSPKPPRRTNSGMPPTLLAGDDSQAPRALLPSSPSRAPRGKGPRDRFVVFYSWQSDLEDEHSRKLIRDALLGAATDMSGLISLDEATRDEPGSPDIPATIFAKIAAADVFVADVSTINPDGKRRTPNPNVLIELGLAAALLGWSRVLLVVNKAFSTFPDDLPFDIDRRRAIPFTSEPHANADANKAAISNARGLLRKEFADRLGEVLRVQPERPVIPVLDAVGVRRQRDIRTLTRLLRHVNPEVIEELVAKAPERLSARSFHFFEGFDAAWTSDATTIYDKKLKKALNDIHENWLDLFSNDKHYLPTPDGHYYAWQYGSDSSQSEDLAKGVEAARKLENSNARFCALLHAHYLEIDVTHAIADSWQRWKRFMDGE